jgi:Fic family protein
MTEPAGTDVAIMWRGLRVQAFVPALLAERHLIVASRVFERTAAASAQAHLAAETMPIGYEPIARMLLRSEGIASSYIEGIAAPVVDVVLAEHDVGRVGGAATWVAANTAATASAIAAASAHDARLTVGMLCEWHRLLMAGSPMPDRYLGAIRDEQGWIGGTSPLDAALVTPPPERLAELLDDLAAFVGRDDLDPILQAAVAHAQFEIIHPFADGNGRVGRILIAWMLTRRLRLVTPPPVSTRIAADRAGYLAGLSLFRLGHHEPWIAWFADAVAGAARAQRALVTRVDELLAEWRTRLSEPATGRALRRDALAWMVLDLLPRHLVLSAEIVARETGRSTRAARLALQELVGAGILGEPVSDPARSPGRPAHVYVSPELLGLI